MRIAIIVEGKTEIVFRQHLRSFLETKLAGKMPVLDFVPYHGRIPTGEKLRRVVENLLGDKKRPADTVIALTDVYTGSQPPDFRDAADAKEKMKNWVGPKNEKFHPHASQHDFEAWLLPYWEKIKKLAGSNRHPFGARPEQVNHMTPPAHRLGEMFCNGKAKRGYLKTKDADRILRGEDLLVAASACPELKAFLNTILKLCGGDKAMIP
jgi:Domain of unknown function (DUF4276)